MKAGIPQITDFVKSSDECLKSARSLRDALKEQNRGDAKITEAYEKSMDGHIETFKKFRQDVIDSSLRMASEDVLRDDPTSP